MVGWPCAAAGAGETKAVRARNNRIRIGLPLLPFIVRSLLSKSARARAVELSRTDLSGFWVECFWRMQRRSGGKYLRGRAALSTPGARARDLLSERKKPPRAPERGFSPDAAGFYAPRAPGGVGGSP